MESIKSHQEADENYIEQGIKLLELAEKTAEIYRTRGQEARSELFRFIMPGSILEKDKVIPAFKQPFDIIHQLAEDAKRATSPEAARLLLLPGLDSNFQ